MSWAWWLSHLHKIFSLVSELWHPQSTAHHHWRALRKFGEIIRKAIALNGNILACCYILISRRSSCVPVSFSQVISFFLHIFKGDALAVELGKISFNSEGKYCQKYQRKVFLKYLLASTPLNTLFSTSSFLSHISRLWSWRDLTCRFVVYRLMMASLDKLVAVCLKPEFNVVNLFYWDCAAAIMGSNVVHTVDDITSWIKKSEYSQKALFALRSFIRSVLCY